MPSQDRNASHPNAQTLVVLARGWIGTPYRHQAATKGAGCDCLGLIRGLWAEFYGSALPPVPAYTDDWSERAGSEPLWTAARNTLRETPVSAAAPGDILLFRMRQSGPAKHLALLSSREAMIHAYSGHAVLESPLSDPWRRRIVAAFRFPERP